MISDSGGGLEISKPAMEASAAVSMGSTLPKIPTIEKRILRSMTSKTPQKSFMLTRRRTAMENKNALKMRNSKVGRPRTRILPNETVAKRRTWARGRRGRVHRGGISMTGRRFMKTEEAEKDDDDQKYRDHEPKTDEDFGFNDTPSSPAHVPEALINVDPKPEPENRFEGSGLLTIKEDPLARSITIRIPKIFCPSFRRRRRHRSSDHESSGGIGRSSVNDVFVKEEGKNGDMFEGATVGHRSSMDLGELSPATHVRECGKLVGFSKKRLE